VALGFQERWHPEFAVSSQSSGPWLARQVDHVPFFYGNQHVFALHYLCDRL
jgi:hypothetical protein